MRWASRGLTVLFVGLLTIDAFAETIEFPTDELASESVLPVFEKVENVKNRNVVTAKRIEVGGGIGFNLMDAFYNPMNFHGSVSYHLDEIHGINAAAAFWMSGLSNYGEQLKNGEGLDGDFFDPSRAPSPKYMLMGNYQYTAYYGKISLSKQMVMNLSLFGLAGLGTIAIGDQNKIAINFGIGEKFYFTKNLALRLDLRMLMYRGPDPTTRRLLPTDAEYPASAFGETTFFHTMLTFGLVYLL